MGYRELRGDVAAAAQAEAALHVTDIAQGDSEEAIVFTYSHDGLDSPLRIHAFVTEASSYPRSHGFLVFTETEDLPPDVESLMENISVGTQGKVVYELITHVARSITTRLENSSISDDNYEFMGLSDEDSDTSEYDISFHEFDEDEDCHLNGPMLRGLSPSATNYLSRDARSLLRNDFAAVLRVGIKPTLVGESYAHCYSIFALPLCVKALGIPKETLEAWDLAPEEYIVLLIRLKGGYPSFDQFLNRGDKAKLVQFRLGKCKEPKPSLVTARLAFAEHENEMRLSNLMASSTSSRLREESTTADDFVSTYVCTPINDMLAKHLPALIRLRRDRHMTWDQAHETLLQEQHGYDDVIGHQSNDDSGIPRRQQECIISREISPALQRDFALDKEDDLSLPLVVLQIALRRLSKSADFCLVCHRKLAGGYNAVKPYICERELCVHQYLNLGLGHAVEHEIIKHPYVVDLLINFFAATIPSNSRTSIPRALGIKTIDRTKKIEALSDFSKNQLWSPAGNEEFLRLSELGRRFLIVYGTSVGNMQLPDFVPTPNFQAFTCSVETLESDRIVYGVLGHFGAPPPGFGGDGTVVQSRLGTTQQGNPLDPSYGVPFWPGSTVATGPQQVEVWLLTEDIDDIPGEGASSERRVGLLAALNSIPSVLHMRSFLQENPERRLSQWARFDKATYTLLNWIIKSNRSYIVQDDIVPGGSCNFPGSDTARQRRIAGLGPEWMQFRFQQGCPDKEHRFDLALQQLKTGMKAVQYRALFAWHGSRLENWHSIIRHGLDFRDVANGRAYGNGVYFSQDMDVSLGYANYNYQPSPLRYWENSVLYPTSAVSLCELINDTSKFTNTDPHLVVPQTDWIRCRYLLVAVRPTTDAQAQPLPSPLGTIRIGYVKQDKNRRLMRGRTYFKVPDLAVEYQETTRISPRRVLNEKAIIKALTQCGIAEADGGSSPNTPSKKRRRGSASSSNSPSPKRTYVGPRLRSKLQDKPTPSQLAVTSFAPGLLNRETLPLLPEPSWAISSPGALRRLTREIKDLQAMQAQTRLEELGWFVDFDRMDNMFQWIVELHSFPSKLRLAKDMKAAGCQSIVLEMRFGSTYPHLPPFVRVIRPLFVPFRQGGGGHVTEGGAICSELLTNSGWLPILSLDKVLLTVRLGLVDEERPARLLKTGAGRSYSIHDAVMAYERAAKSHGWQIPEGFRDILSM